jgi:hypothetical protein
VGLSTDTVEATILAMLNSINRIAAMPDATGVRLKPQ